MKLAVVFKGIKEKDKLLIIKPPLYKIEYYQFLSKQSFGSCATRVVKVQMKTMKPYIPKDIKYALTI